MIVIWEMHAIIIGLSRWLSGKESACQAGDTGSIPGSGRSLGKGNGNPLTPVFLPGESHGQRSLAGYSSWGHKKLDMTEHAHNAILLVKLYNLAGKGKHRFDSLSQIILDWLFSELGFPKYLPTLDFMLLITNLCF